MELRDREERYGGLGVQRAVDHVNTKLAQAVIGLNVFDQAHLDQVLLKTDGTQNKSNIGGECVAWGFRWLLREQRQKRCVFRFMPILEESMRKKMPVPMMNILNGGRHADNTIDFQEFMIMPVGACCFREALRMCSEIYHALKALLKEQGYSTAVGGMKVDLHLILKMQKKHYSLL